MYYNAYNLIKNAELQWILKWFHIFGKLRE